MKFKSLLLVVAALALTTGTVQAQSFVYDFSTMGFADGQNVEGLVLDFVTFTSQTTFLTYQSAFGGIGNTPDNGNTGDVYLDFSAPINFLSITGGDGAGDFDAFGVSLYEFGTNNFLGTFNTPVFGGVNEPEWYTLNLAVANVGKVVFDPANSGSLPGVLGDPFGGVLITDLAYEAVPEPATMVLMGAGMAGLGVVRRIRKRFAKS